MKEGWEIKKLGEVCEMYQPKTISTKEMVDDGLYPVFGANGIIGKYDKYNHEEPQLLITCRGATCGSVNISEPKSWINGNAMVVRPQDHSIDLKFLEYLFRGGIDLSKTITGAAQPQITRQSLIPIEISYPKSLPEQQRIVSILDEAFAAIDKAKANAEQNLKNAKELFKSYLQGVFEKKGEGWVRKPLREVCSDFLQGINTATDKTVFVDEGIPILQAKEIGLNKLDLSNTKFITQDKFELAADRYKPKEGDILYNNIGSSMGRSIIVDWDFDFTIAWNVMRIIPNRKITLPKFLNYILQSPLVYNDIIFKAKGVGMPFISKKDLIEIMVSYPSLTEQKKIVQKLDALAAETKKLEAIYQQKINEFEELKKSVLQKAFAGELRTEKS